MPLDSAPSDEPTRPQTQTEVGGIAAEALRSYITRIERLEEEKAGLAADIREVYAEAKGSGFDPKVMRRIVKDRGANPADLAEFEALLSVYQHALEV